MFLVCYPIGWRDVNSKNTEVTKETFFTFVFVFLPIKYKQLDSLSKIIRRVSFPSDDPSVSEIEVLLFWRSVKVCLQENECFLYSQDRDGPWVPHPWTSIGTTKTPLVVFQEISSISFGKPELLWSSGVGGRTFVTHLFTWDETRTSPPPRPSTQLRRCVDNEEPSRHHRYRVMYNLRKIRINDRETYTGDPVTSSITSRLTFVHVLPVRPYGLLLDPFLSTEYGLLLDLFLNLTSARSEPQLSLTLWFSSNHSRVV